MQVKVWDIPPHGVLKNLTVAWKELQGHSRRVSLIEWHPTANNILFSTGYDYKVTQCPQKTLPPKNGAPSCINVSVIRNEVSSCSGMVYKKLCVAMQTKLSTAVKMDFSHSTDHWLL